jgi:hypothetical protein
VPADRRAGVNGYFQCCATTGFERHMSGFGSP